MQEFIVSTLQDENDGDHNAGDLSLREAISIADPGATITFDSSLTDGTIDLVLGELTIDKDLTIQGLGADNLTIDGSFVGGEFPNLTVNRVFNINDGNDTKSSNVTIEGITITGGNSVEVSGGAGILNTENLSLNSSIVRDNATAGRNGGGISNSGNLVVNNSSITNNTAGSRGGQSGGAFGGGISNGGTARIVNSTIAENNASIGGGGINGNGTLEISNSTITGNTAGFSDSEGIADGISGSATITSSIVAGNGIKDFGEGAVLTSGGNNLIGNGDGFTGLSDGVNGDIVGTTDNPIDPQLGELQDNGGATPTQELLAESPAIDAGSNLDNLTTDQRDEGFNRTVGDGTDIGAFEVQTIPDELVVSTLEDENDGDFSAGDLSLREAILNSSEGNIFTTITFDSSLSSGTITLSMGELLIDKSLNIEGLGSENLTIDANQQSRVFNIDDGDAASEISVGIDGLKITGGNVQTASDGNASKGGGILNQENLTLADANLTNNSATEGGGIYNLEATSNISDSHVDSNSGGGIYNDQSTVNLSNSSVNGNDTGGFNSLASGITSDSSKVSIVDSTVSDNDTAFGGSGGISDSNSTTNIENSVVSNNKTSVFGEAGGIDSDSNSTLRINNSTISNNYGDPGSEFDPKGRRAEASGLKTSGTTIITDSTISNNTGVGDGVLNSGNLDVRNTTVNANAGSGIRTGQGSGTSTISNSTITSNNDVGVSSIDADSVTLVSSIVANNNGPDLITQQGNPVITSGGNNFIGDRGNVEAFVGGENGDLVGTSESPIDPLLGEELQDNGGATLTQELLAGSPAIDAGSNPNSLATDQRGEGFDRAVGNSTDIGAFEVQTVANLPEIVGTTGGDVIEGTEEGDRILGLDGNDTIRSLGGDDTVQGDNGNDSLEGGAGNDSLDGLEGFDSLFGGDDNDTLDGGIGNDSLDGGAGNDLLFGLDDRDTLLGGIGSDTLEGGGGVDSLSGGEGDDNLFGQDDNDSLFGGAGNDLLDGGLGIDSLSGDAGDDRLFGLEDNDSLLGDNGNDLLDGGVGSDSLRGDDGNDTFVISSNAGTDTIADFSFGNDLLGLTSEISFADLSFSGNNIILGTETIANLNGIDTASLTESNFVEV